MGEYANPLDELFINSWISSASISNSHTPGFINFSTLSNPFIVILQACCILSISSLSLIDLNL